MCDHRSNEGVSLRFISSLQLQKILCKGCKLYVILALNVKGVEEGLEHLRGVREFVDVFPEESLGMLLERELEFTIDLKLRTELDSHNALSDVDSRATGVENATE
jgi:hypothetical protein